MTAQLAAMDFVALLPLTGTTLKFVYDGKVDETRTVYVENVKQCSTGVLIIGRDEARQGKYRSFNVSKMHLIN